MYNDQTLIGMLLKLDQDTNNEHIDDIMSIIHYIETGQVDYLDEKTYNEIYKEFKEDVNLLKEIATRRKDK